MPEYSGIQDGSADSKGYALEDGTALVLSEKDQKLPRLRERFSGYYAADPERYGTAGSKKSAGPR